MNEQFKAELQELQNLETQGGLEEAQKSRLEVLRVAEQAEKTAEKNQKDLDSSLAQKEHFREKFEKAESDRKALEEKLNKATPTKSLEVDDFIGISASLEGLDQREKEYLAQQHKLTGKPLPEIKTSEDFLLWQDGYKVKVEKERALKPTGAQPEGDKPKNLVEMLAELDRTMDPRAAASEKLKLLDEAGLYKTPRPRSDRVNIGPK